MPVACDVVLFDFFGTLVHYSPSWIDHDLAGSHEVLRSFGCGLSYDAFLNRWGTHMDRLERQAEMTGHEYSMDDAVTPFLHDVIGTSRADQVEQFRDAYVAEWCTAIRPIPGLPDLLANLARSHTIAVVTNTLDGGLVPRLLGDHGLAPHVHTTVISVNVGVRKPHAGIFQEAVNRLDAAPSRCLFVGDSYIPDYIGPTSFGMQALLIDPDRRSDVPRTDGSRRCTTSPTTWPGEGTTRPEH